MVAEAVEKSIHTSYKHTKVSDGRWREDRLVKLMPPNNTAVFLYIRKIWITFFLLCEMETS